jgi:periplasmic divalent cation tolerance protein
MPETLIVLTTLPDEAAARALAGQLVESGLAACVNMLAPCRSVYRWQGAVEDANEVPLLIKTTAARYA